MRVTTDARGVRIRLNLAESHLLDGLFEELRGVLEPDALDPADPVRGRLFPSGYADPDDALAFRDLTEAGLRTDRTDRVDQCAADLVDGRAMLRTDLTLDPEATERWMRVLNDLRLTLGTRLDISEDDDYELDEDDPDIHVRARYLWLTALQDALVTAVMD